MRNTLEKDHTANVDEAFIDIYRKLRPGEPPTPDSARALLENLFFNPKRYDHGQGRPPQGVEEAARRSTRSSACKRFDLTDPQRRRRGPAAATSR